MAGKWSIATKEPAGAPAASIGESDGKATFPANQSTTTDNVYTITYTDDNGCVETTEYTVKKCTPTPVTQSSIDLYPQEITYSPEGIIYVNIDVSIERGSDGLIEKYENGGYEIDVNVEAASGTRDAIWFSNGSTQLGCLNLGQVSTECSFSTESFLIGSSDLFHGNLEFEENAYDYIDSESPSNCEENIWTDINAQLPSCYTDIPTYEGNGVWRYNGNNYTLVWNYDIVWGNQGFSIDLRLLPEELRNIITIH